MEGGVKIGDFGWSVYSPEADKWVNSDSGQAHRSQQTLAGTLSYVSPEMILGQPHGKAVDIWASAGCSRDV